MNYIVRAADNDDRWVSTFNIDTGGKYSLRLNEVITDSESEFDYRYINPFKIMNLSRTIEDFNRIHGFSHKLSLVPLN